MDRPFIMVAPNGARLGKADHAKLPVTMDETMQTAIDCQAAGANGLHLHVRDTIGAHTLDSGRYLEALAQLKSEAPALKVQITTEAAGVFDVEAQLHCLQQVRPGWASIALREINRTPDLADSIYGTCADNGTKVQHILYDTKDYALLRNWQSRGIVRTDQTDMLFVLGRYLTGRSSQPGDLDPFLATVEGKASWMLCAFGAGEHTCLRHAARLGGDLRVGFENSLTNPDGRVWPDCATSVAALVASLQSSVNITNIPRSDPIGG